MPGAMVIKMASMGERVPLWNLMETMPKAIFLLHQTLEFPPIRGRVLQPNFHKVIDG